MSYNEDYQKENIRRIVLKLNRRTDKEVLEWIEKQTNASGYLKELIKKDMDAQK